MNNRLKLASYNVRGLRDNAKRNKVFGYLKNKNYDIILLQETHCEKNGQQKWEADWDGKIYHNFGTNRSKGAAVLINKNITSNDDYTITSKHDETDGRQVMIELKYNNQEYIIICIYAPNIPDERKTFFKRLNNKIKSITSNTETNILMGGDFNCVMNNRKDRTNITKNHDPGQTEIHELLETHNLEDIWRRRNPEKASYTWNGGLIRANKSRIDYWLISKSNNAKVNDANIIDPPFSDHSLIDLTIKSSNNDRGPGVWMMNVEVLKSPIFDLCFRETWKRAIETKPEYTDYRIWWDKLKRDIKELAIWVSRENSYSRKAEISDVEAEIAKIKDKAGQEERESDLKTKLNELYDAKYEGEKIRSRLQWWEEGEKSSRYFFALEKIRAQNKIWTEIYDKDGKIVEGIENIQQVQQDFYKDLYTSQNIPHEEDKFNEFLNCLTQKLTEEEKEELEKDISIHEMEKAIQLMPNNKSPGLDGIPIEFYKKYWNLIGEEVHSTITTELDEGELSTSQKRTAITLIYKKGERRDIKNWRPLRKINSDRKIGSKVLSERIKKILHKIIHEDQTGGIEGRNIGENVRLLLDLLEMEGEDEEGVLLMMDEEKAYDRAEQPWIYAVMKHVNIGPRYIGWVKALYNDGEACILTNGYQSSFFKVTRGVLQGESLSGFLYIIQAEPLNQKIRKNESIKGITIKKENPTIQTKMAAYMDDTSIHLKNIQYIPQALETIHKFEQINGSKLNISKTKGIVFKRENVGVHNGIECIYGSEKVLGIHIGKHIKLDEIWQDLCEKTVQKLQVWKKRDLSYSGKILLIKSLGISKILYNVAMQCFSDKHFKQFSKILYDFLWDGRAHFIPKAMCEESILDGGMGMPNIDIIVKCARIQWVIRTLVNHRNNNNRTSTILPIKYFSCLDEQYNTKLYTLRTDMSADLVNRQKVPKFYQECITFFQEFLTSTKGLRSRNQEIIWDNSELMHQGKPLRYKHWAKKGILTRNDISRNAKIDDATIREKGVTGAGYLFELSLIKKIITNEWLKLTDERNNNNNEPTINEIIDNILEQKVIFSQHKAKAIVKLTANEIKSLLQKKTTKTHIEKKKRYWNEKIGLEEHQWRRFLQIIYVNKLIPRKVRDFNLRVIHGGINTEDKLKKMNLSPTDTCCICKNEREDVAHLLIKCNGLNQIWEWIQTLINGHFVNNRYTISEPEKLTTFPGYAKIQGQEIITTIISMGRYEIWKRRCKQRYGDQLKSINNTINNIRTKLRTHLQMNYNIITEKQPDITTSMDKIMDFLTRKPP